MAKSNRRKQANTQSLKGSHATTLERTHLTLHVYDRCYKVTCQKGITVGDFITAAVQTMKLPSMDAMGSESNWLATVDGRVLEHSDILDDCVCEENAVALLIVPLMMG